MICTNCHCYTTGDKPHGPGPDDCCDALLDWRKEADARLIEYEEKSAAREALIVELEARCAIYKEALETIVRATDPPDETAEEALRKGWKP